MYYIEYDDGTTIGIYKVRGRGQLRWGWADRHTGNEHAGTHLDCARQYATETGGRFVTVRQQRPKPATPSGYPVGLAGLLRVRRR